MHATIVFLASDVGDPLINGGFYNRPLEYDEARKLILNGVMLSSSFYKHLFEGAGEWLLGEIKEALALSDDDMKSVRPHESGVIVENTNQVIYAAIDRTKVKFYLLTFID